MREVGVLVYFYLAFIVNHDLFSSLYVFSTIKFQNFSVGISSRAFVLWCLVCFSSMKYWILICRSSGDCYIEVSLYESEGDRTVREKATLLRDRVLGTVSPYWRRGIIGHQKVDCRSEQVSSRPTFRKAHAVTISASNVLLAKHPFGCYCKILSEAAQDRIEIRETKLVSDASHDQNKNWNGKRKAS